MEKKQKIWEQRTSVMLSRWVITMGPTVAYVLDLKPIEWYLFLLGYQSKSHIEKLDNKGLIYKSDFLGMSLITNPCRFVYMAQSR